MDATKYFDQQAILIQMNSRLDLENHKTQIIELANELKSIFRNGGKIAFCGNGGSAAEASHITGEFLGKCLVEHEPLPALCLNDSTTILTAIANDYGFEEVFARQVEAQLNPKDLLILLSTSGLSKNVIRAIESANKNSVRTILWTGINCPEISGAEIWRSQHSVTPRIQETHLLWGHLLAEIIERQLGD
jgi:D-sedoheptulose 7-phosphate isomerase